MCSSDLPVCQAGGDKRDGYREQPDASAKDDGDKNDDLLDWRDIHGRALASQNLAMASVMMATEKKNAYKLAQISRAIVRLKIRIQKKPSRD